MHADRRQGQILAILAVMKAGGQCGYMRLFPGARFGVWRIGGLVALAVAFLTASCGRFGRQAAADDIFEAVFRYQLRGWAWTADELTPELRAEISTPGYPKVFFLQVTDAKTGKNADPSDEFLRRFSDLTPRVEKWSEAEFDQDGPRSKWTGERGIRFDVFRVRWIGGSEVEVDGGYAGGPLCAGSITYHLRKVGREWRVERTDVHWLSEHQMPNKRRLGGICA